MEKVAYRRLPWYPNLREGETTIWNQFISRFPDAYDAVVYNLHVGAGAEIPEGTDEAIARDWKMLTQNKIDVVGFKDNRVDIIEIKPRAGAGAIGQVQTYAALYKKEIDPASQPNLVIITDQIRPDMESLTAFFNIRLFNVFA